MLFLVHDDLPAPAPRIAHDNPQPPRATASSYPSRSFRTQVHAGTFSKSQRIGLFKNVVHGYRINSNYAEHPHAPDPSSQSRPVPPAHKGKPILKAVSSLV